MRTIELPLPVLGTIVATRALLAFGAGLLVAPALPAPTRRTLGWALVALGAASTAPLALRVVQLSRRRAMSRGRTIDVGA